ncbi:exocyst complex component 4-like isoform X1 [Physella acuta]|uniref:exocyst complex component 4-like isoform X1 n=1 Tax=Physella acuta TaxID=109671 RepID=UPI0027DBC37D|nr:exocyst complex component 4-like isoform X1 [Physella acuta]
MATAEEGKTPTNYQYQPQGPSSKDSSSAYLMSIVSTLSSSANYDQREKEKTRIEKAFRESDKRLGELVTENYQDVTKILQAFNGMTKSINESREKIRKIKEDLNSCKTLLHFKRDELRKLWKDGVEHKAVLSMLEQVEQMKEVQDKMNTYMANKHYLHATDTIVQAVSMLEGPLNGIDALREVRGDLINIKEKMHETLIEELSRQIYERSLPSSSLQPGSLMRWSRKDATVWGWSDGVDSPRRVPKQDSVESSNNKAYTEVKEDLNSNPEENLTKFIAILTESLFVLRKLPDAVERIKLGMKGSLHKLINTATQQIAESSGQQLDSMENHVQPKYFNELLKLVFQHSRCVAQTHQTFLDHVLKLTPSPGIDNEKSGMPLQNHIMYDMKDVWSEIQARLQILLSQYLDVPNSMLSRQQVPSGFDQPTMDISQYFSKKKAGKAKKVSLFRFDASQHAISVTSARQQIQQQYEHDTLGLPDSWHIIKVCKPGAFNITAIYKPLRSFIREVEDIMQTTSGLQEFITDFVQNVFLGQVHSKVSGSIDAATRVQRDGDSHLCFDALRNVIDEKRRRELGVPRPLLQSTVIVDSCIQELQDLMHHLPDYADQFLNMICNVLRDYREKCHSAYRDIVQHGSDEKRIISAMWAKDEDISRFLRSLPSWRSLQPRQGKELDRTICSEEEIRSLNSKESVILISNLSGDDALIPQQEIITDVTQMRTVANLHESLEWFADRLEQFAASLTSQNSLNPATDELPMELPPISDKTLQSLKQLVQDFKDLAEICLLLLHLEVRVHCFYYLLPVAKQSNYAGPIDDLDPDSNVLKLNKDLSGMEEMMTQSLQPKKFKYIFESLGFLVASILITSVQFLKKINENGIKKMCRNILAIQQNLTNITLARESDLDRARHFYELLYLNPDDLINSVAEKGPQFSLSEYKELIQLYHRSFAGNPVSLQDARMQRLHSVMEKGQDETLQ